MVKVPRTDSLFLPTIHHHQRTNQPPLFSSPLLVQTKSIYTSRSASYKRIFHLDRSSLLLSSQHTTTTPKKRAVTGSRVLFGSSFFIEISYTVVVSSHSSSPSRIEFTMDWEGQKLSEQLMQIMLLGFAVVALVAGYFIGSFMMMLQIYTAGVILTTCITVPNWPFFNRHPLKWLDPIEAERHPLKSVPVAVAVPSTKKSSSTSTSNKSHQK